MSEVRPINKVNTTFLIDGKETAVEGRTVFTIVKEDWVELARLVHEYEKSLSWYTRLKLWYWRLSRRNEAGPR